MYITEYTGKILEGIHFCDTNIAYNEKKIGKANFNAPEIL